MPEGTRWLEGTSWPGAACGATATLSVSGSAPMASALATTELSPVLASVDASMGGDVDLSIRVRSAEMSSSPPLPRRYHNIDTAAPAVSGSLERCGESGLDAVTSLRREVGELLRANATLQVQLGGTSSGSYCSLLGGAGGGAAMGASFFPQDLAMEGRASPSSHSQLMWTATAAVPAGPWRPSAAGYTVSAPSQSAELGGPPQQSPPPRGASRPASSSSDLFDGIDLNSGGVIRRGESMNAFKSDAIRQEDRRLRELHDQIGRLQDRRDTLEAEIVDARAKSLLQLPRSSGIGGGPVRVDAEATLTLARERDVLMEQLRLEENAQLVAARRAGEIEGRLAGAWAELDALRQHSPPRTLSSSHAAAARSADEVHGVRRELAEVRIACEARERQLRACDKNAADSIHRLKVLTGEREACVSQHGALRGEAAAVREQLGVGVEGLRRTESRLGRLRFEHPESKSDLQVEVAHLRATNRGLADDLERWRARLRTSEGAAAAVRSTALEGKSVLASVRCAHDDSKLSGRQRTKRFEQEVARWQARAQELGAEKNGLSAKVDGVRLEMCGLDARRGESAQGLEGALMALTSERCRAVDMDERSRCTLVELERRTEVLAWQLQDERKRNEELTREFSALREAARSSAGRGSGSGRRHHRASALHAVAGRLPCAGDAVPSSAAVGAPKDWGRTWRRLRREIDELRSWKREAAGSVQRMSQSLQTARSGHARQLQYAQELEAAVAQIGNHMQTVTGMAWPGQSPVAEPTNPSAGVQCPSRLSHQVGSVTDDLFNVVERSHDGSVSRSEFKCNVQGANINMPETANPTALSSARSANSLLQQPEPLPRLPMFCCDMENRSDGFGLGSLSSPDCSDHQRLWPSVDRCFYEDPWLGTSASGGSLPPVVHRRAAAAVPVRRGGHPLRRARSSLAPCCCSSTARGRGRQRRST